MVFPGDSLGRLARIFGTSVEALQSANNMRDPNALLVGQLLLIPGKADAPNHPTLLLRPAWCSALVLRQWQPWRTLCTLFEIEWGK